jgi:DNA-binding transcriptional ArsR family regulator
MSEPFKELVNIDRVVHEPARLAILLILEVCVDADFKCLQALTGMAKSNLSLHLTKLETHRLIAIEKTFVRKKGRTVARLTKEGKEALRAHRRRLEEPRRTASKWTLLRRMMSPEPAGR